jgi:hypothetical protein
MESARNRLLESALKYYQQFIDQRGDDPGAQAELTATKARVEKILANLTTMQAAGRYDLLKSAEVLADLGVVDPAQTQKIADMCSRHDGQVRELFKDLFRLSAEDRRKRFLQLADLDVAREAAAREILTPAQLSRLKQIDLQVKGAFAFHDPEVAASLKLTADQMEKIRAIEGDAFSWKPDWGRGGPGGHPGGRGGRGNPPGGDPPHKEPERDPRRVAEKIVAVLTPQQAARWQEMTGPRFECKTMPFGFGGFFGGPGGPPHGPGGPSPGPDGPPPDHDGPPH